MSSLNIYDKYPHSKFKLLKPDEIDPKGIYFLDDGFINIRGNFYGNEIKIVDEYPISPIPNVIYARSDGEEMKMWTNGKWVVINAPEESITNLELDLICK